MANKIMIHSPFKVSYPPSGVDSTGLTKAILYVWIYTGTQGDAQSAGTLATASGNRVDSPAYSLKSTSVGFEGDKFVMFELSNLVKGLVDTRFRGSKDDTLNTSVAWLDYQMVTYVGSEETIHELVRNVAYDGYTYFEEGANYQYDNVSLITSDRVTKLKDEPYIIPVNTSLTSSLSFFSSGSTVFTQDVSSSNLSSNQMAYIFPNTFLQRVNDDSGLYETSSCLTQFLEEELPINFDSVQVTGTDGFVYDITVDTLDPTCYTPYELTFKNRFGALESLWFVGQVKESTQTKSKEYNRGITNYRNGINYSTSDARRYKQNISSNRSITVNSGFIHEDCNSSYEELILSDSVWINYNGQVLPVLVKESSFNYKGRLNDGPMNYTIRLEFAFNRINNI